MGGRVVAIHREDGAVVCARCVLADSAWLRMKGLLGRRSLAADEGVMLRPASSIHMLFMRFPIDAVFLDGDLRVLSIRASLAPWRFAAQKRARAVLEIAAGQAAACGLREGARLVIGE